MFVNFGATVTAVGNTKNLEPFATACPLRLASAVPGPTSTSTRLPGHGCRELERQRDVQSPEAAAQRHRAQVEVSGASGVVRRQVGV
jgi:hypothetical protein